MLLRIGKALGALALLLWGLFGGIVVMVFSNFHWSACAYFVIHWPLMEIIVLNTPLLRPFEGAWSGVRLAPPTGGPY